MRVFKTVYGAGAVAYAIFFATFVLLSSAALLLVFLAWRPIPGSVWNLGGTPAGLALAACSVAGWLLVLVATFQIDHFELTHLPAPLTRRSRPPCAARRPAGTASRSAGGRWRR